MAEPKIAPAFSAFGPSMAEPKIAPAFSAFGPSMAVKKRRPADRSPFDASAASACCYGV